MDEIDDQSTPVNPPDHILQRLEALEASTQQLTRGFEQLAKQVELIPRQVRQMGDKVENMIDAISERRVRDLLERFIALYDLTNQMRRQAVPEAARSYEILRDQILQILTLNGVDLMEESERFDAAQHQVIEVVPAESPEEDGLIVQVYRSGFRTKHGVLRYAEVVVKRSGKGTT